MKKNIFLLLFLSISYNMNAQITPAQKAFATSYTYEYASNFSKAIEEIKSVYVANSYEMNLRLGWLYFLNKNYAESSKSYKNAVDLMPMSIEAKLGYVYPLSVSEKWDEIVKVYKDIIKVEKYNSTANYRLGLIYYNRKDYTAAKDYLENILNIYPFDYDIVILNAWNNVMLGKKEQAKILFEKALWLRPNDASALEGLKK